MDAHPKIIEAGFGGEGSGSGESPLLVLQELRGQVSQLQLAEERRTAQASLLTRLWAVFGAIITAGAVSMGGWVWTIQADVNAAAASIARNAERIEEHRRQGGPMGHPESTLSRTAVNEGRITANADGIRRVEGRLDGIEDKIDEVLERLPRGRR